MNPLRILLVECLDAAGSDAADARERAAALRAAGAAVRAVVLDPARCDPVDAAHAAANEAATRHEAAHPEGRPARIPCWPFEPGVWSRLRALAAPGRIDLALVASAGEWGGRAARELADRVPVRWWPTGFAADRAGESPTGRRSSALPICDRAGAEAEAADRSVGGPDAERRNAGPELDWCSVDPDRLARGRLSIWDGDYLLAPLPLAGEDGARLLEAFAAIADERSALDLVVLGPPQPAFVDEAGALGIGMRVHFAGHAPREAEWSWWAHAEAGVLSGSVPLAGGLLLRALASGCPLLAAATSGTAARSGDRLRGLGVAAGAGVGGRAALAGALARVLEGGPEVETMRARGREVARLHEVAGLARRLAAALDGASRTSERRAAA